MINNYIKILLLNGVIYFGLLCNLIAQTNPTRGINKIGNATVFNYSSPNPKVNSSVTVKDMAVFDPALVFKRGADLTRGIKGEMPTATIATGKTECPVGFMTGGICISVYKYDATKTDGKGKLIYGAFTNSTNTSSFVGNYWGLNNSEEPYWFRPYLSTDIQRLLIRVLGGRSEDKFNVIIEATVRNANFISFNVPGMGIYDAHNFFLSEPDAPKPNGLVKIGCHRGYWEGVQDPENTYRAIQQSISRNFDMIELDMQNTADNDIVVFHDMGLNKRTQFVGSAKLKTLSQLQGMPVKNRFDELIIDPSQFTSNIRSLTQILNYAKSESNAQGKRIPWMNLDRAANNPNDFKLVYTRVKSQGLVKRSIFKGRYPITTAEIITAFNQMGVTNPDTMKAIYFTPVLFDLIKIPDPDKPEENPEIIAQNFKTYVDSWINSGLADGFELTYKAYPMGVSPDYSVNATNLSTVLLKRWDILGNKNFVEYVHSFGYPVGIFASVPEVCAIPDYKTDGTRNIDKLMSGFVKEKRDDDPFPFLPVVEDIGSFDFRGDWDFYIPAGADYVLTDRPDALKIYLQAAGKYKPF